VQPVDTNADETVAPDDELGAIARARRNAAFIAAMVRVQPRCSPSPSAGAAVFALLTVASSFAIGRVIDDVILPRFDEGRWRPPPCWPVSGW
jgi:hypothetical protein